MKNMLLETVEKVIPVIKWQRIVLNCVASDEIEYLAEEISKQSIKGVACFFLTVYSKVWEEINEFDTERSDQITGED